MIKLAKLLKRNRRQMAVMESLDERAFLIVAEYSGDQHNHLALGD